MELEQNAHRNDVTFTQTGMDALLNPKDGDDVIESFSFEKLGRTTAVIAEVAMNDGEEDESVETEGLYSAEEELKGLAVSSSALERFGLLNADILPKLHGCQRELKAHKVAFMKETTITDHFKTLKT